MSPIRSRSAGRPFSCFQVQPEGRAPCLRRARGLLVALGIATALGVAGSLPFRSVLLEDPGIALEEHAPRAKVARSPLRARRCVVPVAVPAGASVEPPGRDAEVIVPAGSSSPDSAPPRTPGLPAGAWRETIDSPDPLLRARAVDLLPRDGASRRTIERIMEDDPDSYVRERAVLAYGEALGREGVERLRELALGDPAEEVRAAALASLDRIETIDPAPRRGRIELRGPSGDFDPRAAFTVAVRFSSRVAVPRATLAVRIPELAESVEPSVPVWKGALAAGEEREVRFTLRFPGALPESAEISARLKLDFEDRLDVELLGGDLVLALGAEDARVSPAATPFPGARNDD
ncbi:MAG: HEAT repeat domain-containing protein [Planctomycetes bacterium]|nr:HEAT repeat domain-containing protein [Planctomycetota bacterium]